MPVTATQPTGKAPVLPNLYGVGEILFIGVDTKGNSAEMVPIVVAGLKYIAKIRMPVTLKIPANKTASLNG